MAQELVFLRTRSPLLPSLPPSLLYLLLLLLPLFLLQLASTSPTARTQLVPNGFSCTQDMPRQSGVYSTPTNSNLAKVDLIHIFCGQIYTGTGSTKRTRVGGFHARPGDSDPSSASTSGPDTQLIRAPLDKYSYAVYKYPYVFDSSVGKSVRKNTSSISSMWPTALSMEGIVQVITELVYSCRPGQGKHLCVVSYSVAQGQGSEVFDVVLIMWNKSRVVRSAYPTRQGTCASKSSSAFDVCSYISTSQKETRGTGFFYGVV